MSPTTTPTLAPGRRAAPDSAHPQRAARRALGLCQDCGKAAPDPGSVTCLACKETQRALGRARYHARKLPTDPIPPDRVCRQCQLRWAHYEGLCRRCARVHVGGRPFTTVAIEAERQARVRAEAATLQRVEPAPPAGPRIIRAGGQDFEVVWDGTPATSRLLNPIRLDAPPRSDV